MSRNHSMSLESNSVVSCVLKWILILFVLNHLVCKQAVFYIIVIVTHLPLNWHNDCGRFSFPLIGHAHCTELSLATPTIPSCHWSCPLYWVVIFHAHCTELLLATPTVPSCYWPRPLCWVVIGHAHCTELSLVMPTVPSCHWPRPL